MSNDIYENDERVDLPEEDDYYTCFGCGWYGNRPYTIEEYGMEWQLCPVCGGECI